MQDKVILGKSLFAWLGVLPLAILNGALREYLLVPLFGGLASPLSGILLSLMIYCMLYWFIPRFGRGRRDTYVKMGVLWVVCTVLFETLLGIAGGESPAVVFGAYNPLTGNLWVFVVLFTGFAPWLAAKRRGLV